MLIMAVCVTFMIGMLNLILSRKSAATSIQFFMIEQSKNVLIRKLPMSNLPHFLVSRFDLVFVPINEVGTDSDESGL